MSTALKMPKVPFDNARMLIGGELVDSESGQWMESINPANEEVLGRVPQGTAKDMDRAVEAAEKAQPEWASAAGLQARRLSQQAVGRAGQARRRDPAASR